jgi:TonB family protein
MLISLTLHGAAAAAYMINPQLLSGAGGNSIATGSTVAVSVVVDSLTEEAPPAPVSVNAVLAPTEPAPDAPAPPSPSHAERSDDAPLETTTADAMMRAKTMPDTTKPEPIIAPPPAPILQSSPPPVAAPATATALVENKAVPVSAKVAASASQGDMLRYSGKIRSKLAAHRPAGIGQKGRVVVTFTIGSTGEVDSIEVSQSSGSQRLDRIVLASVRSASPFSPPPERADSGQRTFSIPFDFR